MPVYLVELKSALERSGLHRAAPGSRCSTGKLLPVIFNDLNSIVGGNPIDHDVFHIGHVLVQDRLGNTSKGSTAIVTYRYNRLDGILPWMIIRVHTAP